MRKLSLLAVILSPILLLSAQHPPGMSEYDIHIQQAIRINELAGHIVSPQDARRLVDMIADMFSDELPPRLATRGIRKRIAQAEYESATNPAKLIPEEQVANAWNRFVTEIGAPDASRVTAEEIHYLRDGDYTTARFFWRMPRHQTIWVMPAIYAASPKNKIADGCRAMETISILHALAYDPENLRWARERARMGILFSDEMNDQRNKPQPATGRVQARLVAHASPPNPILVAGTAYLRNHGETVMAHAIETLLSDSLGLEDRN